MWLRIVLIAEDCPEPIRDQAGGGGPSRWEGGGAEPGCAGERSEQKRSHKGRRVARKALEESKSASFHIANASPALY